MKKYIHILIALFGFTLFSSDCFGQNIAGLPYGTPYEEAYKFLKKKFGKPRFTEGKEMIGFSNAKDGDISFMFANFYFSENKGVSIFNKASFLSNYENYENAFELYSKICQILKDTYKDGRIDFQTEGMGDQFFMQCEFGTHPTNPKLYLGKIRLHRGKNQEGKKYYYVNLNFNKL